MEREEEKGEGMGEQEKSREEMEGREGKVLKKDMALFKLKPYPGYNNFAACCSLVARYTHNHDS